MRFSWRRPLLTGWFYVSLSRLSWHLQSCAESPEHVEEFNDLSGSQEWKLRRRVCWIHTTQFVLWSWRATKQDLCSVPDLQGKRDKHLDNLNRVGQSGCSGCIFILMASDMYIQGRMVLLNVLEVFNTYWKTSNYKMAFWGLCVCLFSV